MSNLRFKCKRQQRRILKIRAERFLNDIQTKNIRQVLKIPVSTSDLNAPSTSCDFNNSNFFHNENSLKSIEDMSCISSSQNNKNESLESELSDTSFVEECQSISSSADFLRNWALKHNVIHTAISDLLSWFKTSPDTSNLPKDARTLLRTPRQLNIYYFGLFEGLLKCYDKHKSTNINTFCLDFNVDGIPIHKSTLESFWPILCRVTNFPRDQPFPVAIFCGPSKPPLNAFFLTL